MELEKHITLTTLSEDGTQTKVEININTIKKIMEKLDGSRLFLKQTPDESLSQLDVTETAEEVKSLIVQAK
jgi:hypothetical protein